MKLKEYFGDKVEGYISSLSENILSGRIKTEEGLAQKIFTIVNNRFKEKKPVTSEEITKMHVLLFDGPPTKI